MQTSVYTCKKLEKLISKLNLKLIKTQKIETNESVLGKWKASVFYIRRKKCLLVTNAKTAYNVALIDIKLADWDLIDDIFKDTLYTQLAYDGIITTFSFLDSIIITLNFYPTDNDERVEGFQNIFFKEVEYREEKFRSLDKINIRDLTHRMNILPIHIGKGRKISDSTTAKKEMKKTLIPIKARFNEKINTLLFN